VKQFEEKVSIGQNLNVIFCSPKFSKHFLQRIVLNAVFQVGREQLLQFHQPLRFDDESNIFRAETKSRVRRDDRFDGVHDRLSNSHSPAPIVIDEFSKIYVYQPATGFVVIKEPLFLNQVTQKLEIFQPKKFLEKAAQDVVHVVPCFFVVDEGIGNLEEQGLAGTEILSVGVPLKRVVIVSPRSAEEN